MAFRNNGGWYSNSQIRHTKLTLVADGQTSYNGCPTLINSAFSDLLHNFREHEDMSVLSSSNLEIGYHCEFNVPYHGSDPDFFFKEFQKRCRLWCEFCRDYNWNVWMSTDMEAAFASKGRSENIHQGIRLQSFSLGAMYDRYTFVEHGKHVSPLPPASVGLRHDKRKKKEHDKRSQLDFEHDSRFLSISYHTQDEFGQTTSEYRLRLRYNEIQEFFLVNDIEGSPLTAFFMLKTPPSFHQIVRDEDPARLTKTPCFDAQVIGNSPVLAVTIANDSYGKFQSAISRLHAFRFKVHWTHIKSRPPGSDSTRIPRFPDNFKMAYALECLLSQGYVITDRADGLFRKLNQLQSSEYDIAEKALQQLALQTEASLEGDRFIDLADQFQKNLEAIRNSEDSDEEQYDNCRYVRRAIVTPTRCILLPAELMSENRILREFGEEFCMRVVFRDESFTKLGSFKTSKSDEIGQRIVEFLTYGIAIDVRRYTFLACSNSQLRDHGCWLYATDEIGHGATDIRNWMGDFSRIKCVATYISRMGQCFSTSEESVNVSVEDGEVEHEGDIKSDDGRYTFSDGIGKVSSSLAKRIAADVNKQKVPSAFQIRYSGCKGMIAIDPILEGDKLVIRESMNKFDSDHKGIEIMNNSKPCRLYLNRQAITLLSGLEIKDDVFKELQEDVLYNHGRMFFYDDDAAESLSIRASQQTTISYRQLVRAGISMTNEPFFRGLLLAVYRNSIGQLQRKARIEIPFQLGRNMIGVLDETGILEYGQVFIQYSKNLDKPQVVKKIHEGEVAITKFPALHPGDFRKFEAVDVEDLHHLVDCVVFPKQGHRPHPDAMAGSDLDGDEYFVTWMSDLIFDRNNEEPMDFVSAPKKIKLGTIEEPDMIQYIADYIKNDNVGLIANAHLAKADHQKKGVFSRDCIKIADIFSKAVDFAKTGYSPDLSEELRPHRYPDFMGKRDKSTYKSHKILGSLYRQCRQIDRVAIRQKETDVPNVPCDSALEHPGWRRFKTDAEKQFHRYTRQLEAIMKQYGITSESEVLSGNIGRLGKLYSQRNELYDAKIVITLQVKHLWNKTRRVFFEEFGGRALIEEFPEDCLAKASAWYMITYRQADKKYLSFPWVAADVLCEVRKRNPEASSITVTSIWQRLAMEAFEYGPTASNDKLRFNKADEYPSTLYLPMIIQYIQDYPWLRPIAGVLIKWRSRRGLKKVLGKVELLNLLLGFAIQHGFLVDTDDDKSMKLLVDFFSFCASRKFHSKEERHIPPTCHYPRLSKSHLEKISTAADKAYHQLALCGTIRSILEKGDDPNEENHEEYITIGYNLFESHARWQQKLKEEFPKVEVNVRRLGGRRARTPNARVTIKGPLSQVNEVQDQIEEWENDPSQFEADLGDLDHVLANLIIPGF